MSAYSYKAMARSGEILSGEIDALNEGDAIHKLQGQGHYPISVAAKRSRFLASLLEDESRKALSPSEIGIFISQLTSLIAAGLPVERGLSILRETTVAPRLLKALNRMLESVRAGYSLSESLTRLEQPFPDFYVTTIRAAEQGGFLLQGLQRLAAHHQKHQSLKEALKSALIYPTILVVMSGLAILFILTVVLPQFRVMFENADVQLPLPAALLMGLSGFLEAHAALVTMGAALCLAALLAAFRSRDVRAKVAAAILRLPLIGETLIRLEISKFSYALGLLLENGAPFQQSISLAGDIVSNPSIANAIKRTSNDVREGMSLADSLLKEKFPSAVIELVRIGEETGRLPAALNHLAELFDKDVRQKLERAVAYLVPSITIGLGAVIALLIASVFSALISINELVV